MGHSFFIYKPNNLISSITNINKQLSQAIILNFMVKFFFWGAFFGWGGNRMGGRGTQEGWYRKLVKL